MRREFFFEPGDQPTLHWFETEVLAEERNYQGLARLNTALIQHAVKRPLPLGRPAPGSLSLPRYSQTPQASVPTAAQRSAQV